MYGIVVKKYPITIDPEKNNFGKLFLYAAVEKI